MKAIIYGYHLPINGKWYVGQTINEKQRKASHKKCNERESGKIFYKAIAKYGYDSFQYYVLEEVIADTQEDLKLLTNEREKFWISDKDSFRNGYNGTIGGEGCYGYKHTEEHKAYISKISKGRNMSESTKEKLRIANKGNNYWLGKKHSEDTKKKLSEIHRTNLYSLGLVRSSETKSKMSKAKSKAILQYSLSGVFISEYPSATMAAHQLSIDRKSISDCCIGRQKTSAGYVWHFKEDILIINQ